MTQQGMTQLAREVAARRGVDPATFCALVHRESGWNTWATRYEPAFYDRYVASMTGLTQTEMRTRATSFGLGQVMGQTARELGFANPWLAELCDPAIGLDLAACKFHRCVVQHPGDLRGALLAYNGGSDSGYPDAVLKNVGLYA